jgi:hypothetical protein
VAGNGRTEPVERIVSLATLLDEAVDQEVFAPTESVIKSNRSQCSRLAKLAVQVRPEGARAMRWLQPNE